MRMQASVTLTSEPEIKACDSKQAWRERHVSAVVLDVRFKKREPSETLDISPDSSQQGGCVTVSPKIETFPPRGEPYHQEGKLLEMASGSP